MAGANLVGANLEGLIWEGLIWLVTQSKSRDFFFYLEHGIVHKVVVLLMRLLCCQKVCLLTQKQSFATIISDGSGA